MNPPAARLILRATRFDHASTLLKQLHWLPLLARILYKHNCFAVSAITFDTLSSLFYLLQLHCPSRSLRFAGDTRRLTAKLKVTAHSPTLLLNHGTLSFHTSDMQKPLSNNLNNYIKSICEYVSVFVLYFITVLHYYYYSIELCEALRRNMNLCCINTILID